MFQKERKQFNKNKKAGEGTGYIKLKNSAIHEQKLPRIDVVIKTLKEG